MNTTYGLIKGWPVEWNERMNGPFDRKIHRMEQWINERTKECMT